MAYLTFFLTAFVVIIADQLTKTWIQSNLFLGEVITNDGFFRLVYIHNSGAIFGLFPNQPVILAITAILGAAFILFFAVYLYRRFEFLEKVPWHGPLGMILGGTIGNLIDRIRFGYVTDFISIGPWPAFNIADSAVSVGAAIFAFFMIRWALTDK